ncbi:RNA-directed DNA polymerase [Mycobacteroides abscessus]
MREADPALLTRMDIRTSLDTETSGPRRDLLPLQVGDLAARTKLDEVAAIIATRAREGRVGTEPAPVLAASKWRHGRRPAAALALPERVLYRAATSLLGDGLAGERDKNDHSVFVNAPVQNGDAFVIVTDLANYYSSIQIDRLADVLLSRTGEWSTVTWLRDFLRAISPSVGGLPQGSYASDRLADTYADTLLRKLRRRGLSAWRYSDDFRIGASSYQDAINALEIFDEETRAMGLFVNERKTYVVPHDRYVGNLDQERRFFSQSWKDKREQLTTIDIYSFEPVEPQEAEIFGAVAMEELQAWAKEVESARGSDERTIATRLDLGLVLAILTMVEGTDALTYVPDLLLMEPQLTHQVAGYLYTMSTSNAAGVDAAVLATIRDTALSKWKSIWLCYSLSNPEREEPSPPWGADPLDADVATWLKTQAASDDEVLSSQAVWALAVNRSLDTEIWSSFNSGLGTYSAQYAAAALAALAVPNKEELDSGDQFDKIVREWAESLW